MNELVSLLQEKCGICEHCIKIFFVVGSNAPTSDNKNNDVLISKPCPLCFGLLSHFDTVIEEELTMKIWEKIHPYANYESCKNDDLDCSFQATINFISKDSPTINLPNSILFIAHCINCTIEHYVNKYDESSQDSNLKEKTPCNYKRKKLLDVYNEIKEQLRSKVRKLIMKINNESNEKIRLQSPKQNELNQDLTTIIREEEAGYLKWHFIFTSPLSFPVLPFLSWDTMNKYNRENEGNIISLPSLSSKKDRKRFRGNDPVAKQGGDPTRNLKLYVKGALSTIQDQNLDKFEETGMYSKSTIEGNIHCNLLEKNVIIKHLETIGSRDGTKQKLADWFMKKVPELRKDYVSIFNQDISVMSHQLHNIGTYVACWRNHFYLKGKYTKSRRDVSQTPFFVSNNKNVDNGSCSHENNNKPKEISNHSRMKRLGVSSVEEEICPIIALACNGISSMNNEQVKLDSEKKSSNNYLVYGMCKFHASGREDMDVRMILPLATKNDHRDSGNGSGRPFICEVIDAFKFPSILDLNKAVQLINQNSVNNTDYDESSAIEEVILTSDGKWVHEDDRIHLQYGKNPRGVGISGLSYCKSSLFSGLQSETEDKVKFYGCLCWSKNPIQSQKYLEEKLMNQNSAVKGKNMYPLRIEQSTPLRVLHRRSACSRVRHVLSLEAIMIDAHWFRLHLSTSAGTYVKEFCHGDCGRTKPSISSLLGCKVDIVELDCEGIAV